MEEHIEVERKTELVEKPKPSVRIVELLKETWKNEEAKSAIQSLANLATTISAFLALCALAWTIVENNNREAQEQIRNLQKPMVYSIIRDKGVSTLEEIQIAYIAKAEQSKLPRQALRDSELDRVILSLMESHVIVRDPSGRYLPTVTSTRQDQVAAGMLEQLEEQQQAIVVRSRILSLIESETGKYTISTLYDKLKEEGLAVSFELVANLISDLRSARLVFKDQQKYLHDTYDTESEQ